MRTWSHAVKGIADGRLITDLNLKIEMIKIIEIPFSFKATLKIFFESICLFNANVFGNLVVISQAREFPKKLVLPSGDCFPGKTNIKYVQAQPLKLKIDGD